MPANTPNLFLIDQPRSGTTSLWQWLSDHPDVLMAPYKEPGFFCTDLWEESDAFHGRAVFFPVRRERQYLELFRGPRKPLVGEATPYYLFSEPAVQRILDFNPDARFIVLLREPVSFLISLHRHLVASGMETAATLPEALDLEPARRRGLAVPRAVICPSFLYYTRWVAYDELLTRLFATVPPHQRLVLFFEDLVHAPCWTLRRVVRFLQIRLPRTIRLPSENAGGTAATGRVIRTFFPPAVQAALRRIIPMPLHVSLWLWGKRMVGRRSAVPNVPRVAVQQRLEPELRRLYAALSDQLGIKLDAWRRQAQAA